MYHCLHIIDADGQIGFNLIGVTAQYTVKWLVNQLAIEVMHSNVNACFCTGIMHKCVLDCCTSYQEEMLIHNGKTVFVGYPSSSGNGSCFATYSSLAITSACKNPEAAWSFIRQMLTGEMTENVGFPINRSKFDALFERAMTPYTTVDPQTGETVEEPLELYWGGILYAMTQAEYDGFMKVYESCNTVWDSTNRDELYQLIGQECAAFFAGQKSAEETARLIQDRVGLFIVEQG